MEVKASLSKEIVTLGASITQYVAVEDLRKTVKRFKEKFEKEIEKDLEYSYPEPAQVPLGEKPKV